MDSERVVAPDAHRDAMSLEWVAVTDRHCPQCQGREQCVMHLHHRGYMLRYCPEAGMPYAVFRVRPCGHRLMQLVDQALGKRFAARQFATFRVSADNSGPYQAARAYAEAYVPGRTARGLYFSGVTGVGKTHLAAAVLREVVRRGETSFRWVLCPEREGSFRDLSEVRFLVLDDLTELALGAGYQRHQTKRDLFALLNRRYEADLPTIVTSRLGEAEMSSVFGGELVGRILEICDLVVMGGQSWRGV